MGLREFEDEFPEGSTLEDRHALMLIKQRGWSLTSDGKLKRRFDLRGIKNAGHFAEEVIKILSACDAPAISVHGESVTVDFPCGPVVSIKEKDLIERIERAYKKCSSSIFDK